jgi:hypothetical protein
MPGCCSAGGAKAISTRPGQSQARTDETLQAVVPGFTLGDRIAADRRGREFTAMALDAVAGARTNSCDHGRQDIQLLPR